MPYKKRKDQYKQMITALKQAKEKEEVYQKQILESNKDLGELTLVIN